MEWLILPFVALSGALNAVQSGANARLAKALGQPWWAAVAVYATGLCGVGVALAAVRAGWPGWDKAAEAPWWAWTGGLLGAVYVIGMLMFAERLGSAVFTGVTVTAGLVASLALDHYGLVGFRQHPLNLWRGIGAALMLGGLGLIARF